MATDPPSPSRSMVKTEAPNSSDPYMTSYPSTNVPRLPESSPYQTTSVNERVNSVHKGPSQESHATPPPPFDIHRTPTPPQLPLLHSNVSNSPSYSRQRTPVTESVVENNNNNNNNHTHLISQTSSAPNSTNASNGYRPLNVKDALTYLDQVKVKFSEQPEVYNRFLDIMKEFKSQAIDTPGVIERVSTLFRGHPLLISGFNTFLPPGYRIECSTDALSRDVIKVTTPTGTTSTTNGEPLHLQPETLADNSRYYSMPQQQTFHGNTFRNSNGPLPPISSYHPSQPLHTMGRTLPLQQHTRSHSPPPMTSTASTTTVASSPSDESRTRRAPVEFNHAINYVNKIKNRFANDPETYKQFLEILQTYQKEQKPIQEVYAQVQILFNGANDLLAEFKQFLPDTTQQLPPQHDYYPLKNKKKKGMNGLPKQKKTKTLHSNSKMEHMITSDVRSPILAERRPMFSLGEAEYFERVKKYIGQKHYMTFVRSLHLFSLERLDANELIERCEPFLGSNKDLMDQLKKLVGSDGKDTVIENVPVKPKIDYLQQVNTAGPSYRLLPQSLHKQNCSGRDALCWEVLNDAYVSRPTWRSEDHASCIATKKNVYEEALYRVEDERYSYDMNIEANLNTIALLEPVSKKLGSMTEEEKNSFKLAPGLGGPSKTIYQRVMKKIYGKEQGAKVVEKLHNQPAQTVPVVLKRLKQKDEEWRRSQREWNKVWREIEIKNYYKALDYQGVVFKANDRKKMTVKHLVQQIEESRLEQFEDPQHIGADPQFRFAFKSKGVFKDVTRLLYSYFERQTMYGHDDCEIMKAFIEMFLPVFFDVPDVLPSQDKPSKSDLVVEEEVVEDEDVDDDMEEENEEDNDTQNSYDSSTDTTSRSRRSNHPYSRRTTGRRSPRHKPNDEEQKLLKGVLTKSIKSYPLKSEMKKPIEIEGDDEEDERVDTSKEQKIYNFFGNTTFYCFFRLFQICYERLYTIKQLDREYRLQGEKVKIQNKAGLDLTVTMINFNSIEMDFKQGYYKALLKLIDRFFDDEFDQHVFEECTRYLFGTKAYILFTIDKLMLSIMRQLHHIVTDPKAQELLSFFKKNHEHEKSTAELTEAYRSEVTESLRENDNLYNLAFDTLNRTLSIQLLEKDDETYELNDMDRYTEYVGNYTNWDVDTPHIDQKSLSPCFLKRNIQKSYHPIQTGLEYKICHDTYHLFYVIGTEDVLVNEKRKAAPSIKETSSAFRLLLDKNGSEEIDAKTRSHFTSS